MEYLLGSRPSGQPGLYALTGSAAHFSEPCRTPKVLHVPTPGYGLLQGEDKEAFADSGAENFSIGILLHMLNSS